MLATGILVVLFLSVGVAELTLEELLKVAALLQQQKPCPQQCQTCKEKKVCPNGWTRFGKSCYLFVAERLSYSMARSNCLALDADLITIESSVENNFIVGHLKALKESSHWIGLTDTETEGVFKWENGNALSISFWSSGQPDDGGGEDCAHYYSAYGYKWNDDQCYKQAGSICEIVI